MTAQDFLCKALVLHPCINSSPIERAATPRRVRMMPFLAGGRSSGWDPFSLLRTLIFTSSREPSRLRIYMRRSTVDRPRSALRMREKSAAAIPVRS